MTYSMEEIKAIVARKTPESRVHAMRALADNLRKMNDELENPHLIAAAEQLEAVANLEESLLK